MLSDLKNLVLPSIAAFAMSGCATTLKPAPDAELTGDEDVAVGRAHQVELRLEADAWNAFPRALEQRLTPMRATLINHSDRPLEVKYEHFSMSGFDSVTYHPLPPLDIKGSVTQPGRHHPGLVPRFAYHRFLLAPDYHPYYDPHFTAIGPWTYRLYDPFYHRRHYPMWQVDLPTRDMMELAIPEGVIEPQGQVSGFLYFPELEAADRGDQVTFTADLVDAKTDEPLGRISVPLVVE